MPKMDDLDARWHALSEEVISGMKEWRIQHPKATFQEIERALDERLARMRARMLEDAALVSRVRSPIKSSTRSDSIRPPIPIITVHRKSSAAQAKSLYCTGRHASNRARFPLRFTHQIEPVSIVH